MLYASASSLLRARIFKSISWRGRSCIPEVGLCCSGEVNSRDHRRYLQFKKVALYKEIYLNNATSPNDF